MPIRRRKVIPDRQAAIQAMGEKERAKGANALAMALVLSKAKAEKQAELAEKRRTTLDANEEKAKVTRERAARASRERAEAAARRKQEFESERLRKLQAREEERKRSNPRPPVTPEAFALAKEKFDEHASKARASREKKAEDERVATEAPWAANKTSSELA